MTERKDRAERDIKMKLQVSWRKVFRAMMNLDRLRTGLVSVEQFKQALKTADCYLQNDEIAWVEKTYGTEVKTIEEGSSGGMNQRGIDYNLMNK